MRPLAATETSFDAQPATEILLSATNPNGWRLDELIAQIRTEFGRQLLALDTRDDQVRARLLGYEKVVAALWEAEGRYRSLGSHQTRA